MRLSDLIVLEYLHDARLESVCFSITSAGMRLLEVRVHAHDDCDYEPWNGKKVTVTLSNVFLVTAKLLGHATGSDAVSIFREGVSQETEVRLNEARAFGFAVPHVLLSLALSSGSEIEIVCETVDVVVGAPGNLIDP